jgi:hypothetical protein
VKEETKVDKFNINKDSEDDFELEEEFENFKKTATQKKEPEKKVQQQAPPA